MLERLTTISDTYRVEAGREGSRPGREARFLVCAAICEHCVHPGGQVPLTTCAAWALIWHPLQYGSRHTGTTVSVPLAVFTLA